MSKRINPPDTETALRIYMEHPFEIGNAEIKELFGIKSDDAVARIKKEVRAAQGDKTT